MDKNIKKVKYDNQDFLILCKGLEEEHIKIIKEQRSSKCNCLNNLDKFTTVYLYYLDNLAVGSIALTDCINDTIEIGRVYVLKEYRNRKVATNLFLKAFETAKFLGAKRIVLDTYKRFDKAISLYKKLGFYEIDNYLTYSPYSICMEKQI